MLSGAHELPTICAQVAWALSEVLEIVLENTITVNVTEIVGNTSIVTALCPALHAQTLRHIYSLGAVDNCSISDLTIW